MMCADKRALRHALRAQRGNPEEAARQSSCICRHILTSEAYRRARVIGGYMPLLHEADITPVLLDALRCGKMLALPRCQTPPNMTFHRVGSLEPLITGAYAIPEPDAAAPQIRPEEIDLLLVPLEGIDRRGFRLGKGGGYYDCLLGECRLLTMGCALDWQRTDELPADVWDQPLACCAFADGLQWFSCEKDS